MTNTNKILLALGVLAGLSACGGDDSKSNTNVTDAGGIIVATPDGGTGTMDSGVGGQQDSGTPNLGDAGGNSGAGSGCFAPGAQCTTTDFLNAPTTAQTTTKPMLGYPASFIMADGGLKALGQ